MFWYIYTRNNALIFCIVELYYEKKIKEHQVEVPFKKIFVDNALTRRFNKMKVQVLRVGYGGVAGKQKKKYIYNPPCIKCHSTVLKFVIVRKVVGKVTATE